MGLHEKAADAAAGTTAFALATSASSQRIIIPASMAGKFCIFAAEGKDVYIRFGGTSVAVSATAVATVASEALTEDATSPHLFIPAGTAIERRIPTTFTKFAHISLATGGFLRFGPSEGAFGSD